MERRAQQLVSASGCGGRHDSDVAHRAAAAKKAKRTKPAAASAVQPAGTPKKPFAMSFDGVTDAQHISYMIARGAR